MWPDVGLRDRCAARPGDWQAGGGGGNLLRASGDEMWSDRVHEDTRGISESLCLNSSCEMSPSIVLCPECCRYADSIRRFVWIHRYKAA